MVQNLPDDHWILNAGDHLGRSAADLASFHVNIEHPFQSKVVRELGLERRETVRSLSAVGAGDLRRVDPSTRGPG